MVRVFLRPYWIVMLLAAVPACAHAADDSPALPEVCTTKGKGKDGARTCGQQQDCIDAKFKTVLERDPSQVCSRNKDAGWDKSLAQKLNIKSDPNCAVTSSVCVGTYERLQKAVVDYKDLMNQACQAAQNAPTCDAGQAGAIECAKKVAQAAEPFNDKAKKALQTAVDESKEYRKLTQEAASHYHSDELKMNAVTASATDSEEAKNASTITGNKLGNGDGTVLAGLKADVSAGNGGQKNISDYKVAAPDLEKEQKLATQTIDEFNRQAASELKVRTDFSSAVKTNVAADDTNGKAQSTVTGGEKDSGNNLLNQANNVAKLASAGTGLASAMNSASNMSGSSSPSAAALDGINGGVSSSTAPTPQSNNPLTSSFGASRALTTSGSGAPDASGKSPSRDLQVNRGSNLDGYSGSAGVRGQGYNGSSQAGAGITGSSGLVPASFASPDAPLGMPKIGAADPALATKGALDNLFGPLPSLDSLIPKDPTAAGAAPALESMFLKVDAEAGVPLAESQASAAAVALANTRSLFDRVHSVHEVALKRGTVALYHKKL